ncbi:hypothetical protein PAXINDRAFT_18143 [Paxillus involutus ATCC 200175]|uniref:Uncharacterized protein n=1 Tax=Paxillus involutus ATCC 200175 TaxID=664439 RepID=A0A0C9TLV7_PAXIN|nr:hypothetical protein PAXINDRAFT_18143 [Paxillus involutus ATCC 200175]
MSTGAGAAPVITSARPLRLLNQLETIPSKGPKRMPQYIYPIPQFGMSGENAGERTHPHHAEDKKAQSAHPNSQSLR